MNGTAGGDLLSRFDSDFFPPNVYGGFALGARYRQPTCFDISTESGLRPNFRDAVTPYSPVSVRVRGESVPGIELGDLGDPRLLILAGFTCILFAETCCSRQPFSSIDEGGNVVFGDLLSSNEVFDPAIARFQQALTLAGVITDAEERALQENLARVGLGRAYLGRGLYVEAAAVVASVPDDFVQEVECSENSAREVNGVFIFNNVSYRWSVSDYEGGGDAASGEALPFITADDPRVPVTAGPQPLGVDNQMPLFL